MCKNRECILVSWRGNPCKFLVLYKLSAQNCAFLPPFISFLSDGTRFDFAYSSFSFSHLSTAIRVWHTKRSVLYVSVDVLVVPVNVVDAVERFLSVKRRSFEFWSFFPTSCIKSRIMESINDEMNTVGNKFKRWGVDCLCTYFGLPKL